MAFRHRGLTAEEIEYWLNKTDSEDEVDISDDDSLADPNFVPLGNSETEAVEEIEESDSSNIPTSSVCVPSIPVSASYSYVGVPGPSVSVPAHPVNDSSPSASVSKKTGQKKEILWRRKI